MGRGIVSQRQRDPEITKGAIVDKGLVTNYGEGGGPTKREGGGQVKFYPHEKRRGWGRGGGEGFSHAQVGGGGHKHFWGRFYEVA